MMTAATETIQQIKRLLVEEGYRPGDKLPTERDLAARLGVSRDVVHNAVRTLAAIGVLETRQGSGIRMASQSANLFAEPFQYLMLLQSPSFETLHESRASIEITLAGMAAERRTDRELARIDDALEQLRVSGYDADGTANNRFHRAIAEAAHNPILEPLLSCLLDQFIGFLRREYYEPGNFSPDWVVAHEIHERIARAIREQDVLGARTFMQQDMNRARQVGEHYQKRLQTALAARR